MVDGFGLAGQRRGRRFDDVPQVAAGDASIVHQFHAAVRAAGIDAEHGRNSVLFRAVDYWLWGLGVGLTEDPERCRRLLTALSA